MYNTGQTLYELSTIGEADAVLINFHTEFRKIYARFYVHAFKELEQHFLLHGGRRIVSMQ